MCLLGLFVSILISSLHSFRDVGCTVESAVFAWLCVWICVRCLVFRFVLGHLFATPVFDCLCVGWSVAFELTLLVTLFGRGCSFSLPNCVGACFG